MEHFAYPIFHSKLLYLKFPHLSAFRISLRFFYRSQTQKKFTLLKSEYQRMEAISSFHCPEIVLLALHAVSQGVCPGESRVWDGRWSCCWLNGPNFSKWFSDVFANFQTKGWFFWVNVFGRYLVLQNKSIFRKMGITIIILKYLYMVCMKNKMTKLQGAWPPSAWFPGLQLTFWITP